MKHKLRSTRRSLAKLKLNRNQKKKKTQKPNKKSIERKPIHIV